MSDETANVPIELLIQKLDNIVKQRNVEQTLEITKQIHEVSENLSAEIGQNRKQIQDLSDKYAKLERENKRLHDRVRRNNIVIYGIDTNVKDLIVHTLDVLNKFLDIDLRREQINNIKFLGRSETNRPVLVELVSYLTKLDILKQTKKLKGTKIFITHELTQSQIEEQKILRRHLQLAKLQGFKAFIRGNRLSVNSVEYTAEQLADIPEVQDTEFMIPDIPKSNSAPPTPNRRETIPEAVSTEGCSVDVVDKTSLIFSCAREAVVRSNNTGESPGLNIPELQETVDRQRIVSVNEQEKSKKTQRSNSASTSSSKKENIDHSEQTKSKPFTRSDKEELKPNYLTRQRNDRR